MGKTIRKSFAVVAACVLSTVAAANAFADEWPLAGGDYWEVTGIEIKDYMILANVHARKGEPDLYLVRVREDIPSGKEGQKRNKEYRDWIKKSAEQMVDESGNRAEYREVMSDSLLQVLMFRD